ncbi:hypothetical protein ABV409_02315 [Flagellimonas sp. DF-77]|uniref:hypothetical protein n=1 Tax=Flagellimonas algarum TaxID=3230298 RepID=UPI0033966FCF
MATKAEKKATNKKSLNNALINATVATINTTVENGEKWQKLTKKMVKKSEPVRRKQMDMVFETATAVKNQMTSGKERMLDLVGYEEDMMERAVEFASNTKVGKKVINVTETLKEKVAENPMVKKAEKTADGLKAKGTAKLNDLRGDVLEQAKKILNKGEELVEEAMVPKKAAKKVKKNVTKAKNKVQETAKVATKKATATAGKVVTTATAVVKDDLKLINGIGPKLEKMFNEGGIQTFAQLAKASEAKIKGILEKAGPIFKNANFSEWVKQAEELAKSVSKKA